MLILVLAPPGLRPPLMLGVAVLTGLLGRDMVRWSLARRGYVLAHVLAARDEEQRLGAAARPRGRTSPSATPRCSDDARRGRRLRQRQPGFGCRARSSAAAGCAEIAAEIVITAEPETVAAADRVVLPGQGAFRDCAQGLAAMPGLRDAIERSAASGRPFLGICVGMQLDGGARAGA